QRHVQRGPLLSRGGLPLRQVERVSLEPEVQKVEAKAQQPKQCGVNERPLRHAWTVDWKIGEVSVDRGEIIFHEYDDDEIGAILEPLRPEQLHLAPGSVPDDTEIEDFDIAFADRLLQLPRNQVVDFPDVETDDDRVAQHDDAPCPGWF